MKPRKVRLSGQITEVPREDLRQVSGGGRGTWETEPAGFENAREHAGDHASDKAPFQQVTWESPS